MRQLVSLTITSIIEYLFTNIAPHTHICTTRLYFSSQNIIQFSFTNKHPTCLLLLLLYQGDIPSHPQCLLFILFQRGPLLKRHQIALLLFLFKTKKAKETKALASFISIVTQSKIKHRMYIKEKHKTNNHLYPIHFKACCVLYDVRCTTTHDTHVFSMKI